MHQHALSKQKIEKRESKNKDTKNSYQNSSFSLEKRFDISDLNPSDTKRKIKKRKGKSMNAAYRTTLNYGVRLYQKGLQKLEEVERKHKEALAAKEATEANDATFHPKINQVSNYFASNDRPENHLIKQGMLVKDKLDQKRAASLYETQQACSFHPAINGNSRKIAEQRSQFFEDDGVPEEYSNFSSNYNDQFSHLYEDAMKRVERHNKIYSMCIDSECTFKPDIGKTKHKFTGRKVKPNKQIDYKYNNENFDPVTGQKYFKPKICRSPVNKKHRSSKSIGNLLYENKTVYNEKKQKLIEEHEKEINEQINQKHCKPSSEAMIETLKFKRFAMMFQLLDSNGDGLISAQKINLSHLSADVIKIMTPLFCEMEELGQTLDCAEFIEATKLLYNTLTINDKNKLLAISQKWESVRENFKVEHSFEPELNKKSMVLAQRNRDENERIEDKLIFKKKEVERRLQNMREIKHKKELDGCTFQPQIHNPPNDFVPAIQNMQQYDNNIMAYLQPTNGYGDLDKYIYCGNDRVDSEAY